VTKLAQSITKILEKPVHSITSAKHIQVNSVQLDGHIIAYVSV
jgi:hypothetical protein